MIKHTPKGDFVRKEVMGDALKIGGRGRTIDHALYKKYKNYETSS
jgi:hypothetical protein